ncbi:hypothetical protein E4U32_004716 [Claviceps aff. humidiphila group G2b]|nr:hypothetical protein E4U32_004716 [Claviceps aff. humidiphila group G2b]
MTQLESSRHEALVSAPQPVVWFAPRASRAPSAGSTQPMGEDGLLITAGTSNAPVSRRDFLHLHHWTAVAPFFSAVPRSSMGNILALFEHGLPLVLPGLAKEGGFLSPYLSSPNGPP